MVGRGAEDQPLLTDSESPSVVVAGPDEFQISHVRRIRLRKLEPPESLAKRLRRIARNFGRTVVVTLHGPDPVIQTVTKIADSSVRVTKRPV